MYTGASMDEVRAAYARGDRAWCGLAHLLQDAPSCSVAIRPHGPTFVAVAKPKSWLGERAPLRCACCAVPAALAMKAGLPSTRLAGRRLLLLATQMRPRMLPPPGAGGGDAHACQLSRREALSVPRVLAALLGAFLFWYAPVLSESTPFRCAPLGACFFFQARLWLGMSTVSEHRGVA